MLGRPNKNYSMVDMEHVLRYKAVILLFLHIFPNANVRTFVPLEKQIQSRLLMNTWYENVFLKGLFRVI